MKLLFFIYSLDSGGAQRVTANLSNYWAEKGWSVTIVTVSSIDDDFYQLHSSIKRISLNLASNSNSFLQAIASNLRRVLALRRALQQVKPDIAVSMMSTSNILLALAAMKHKGLIKVGAERIHPPKIPLSRMWEFLRRYMYGKLDAVIALTSESSMWLSKHTKAKYIPIIPNATPWPLPKSAPYLPTPVKNDGQYFLLAAGRLDMQKGFDILLSVFHKLVADFSQWQLFILGEGPLRTALQSQISNLGVQQVHLPGRTGNLGQWYELADIYVMSSRFEGFPNTLVEAMAHGLPAISFDCDTGPRDIIRHEEDGLLIPAEDCLALEAGLRRLMSNPALRAKWGAQAKEVRERFSLERVTGMWEELFEKLLDTKQS